MKLGLYQHYKGNLYNVIGVARHSETLEEMVVYQSLYGEYRLWTRPRAMFEKDIQYNGQTMSHFKYIGEIFTQLPSVDNEHS
jgi:hypothetical protein